MEELNIQKLKIEAVKFSLQEKKHKETSIYGITDGKAVGTYFEHKFKNYLKQQYHFQDGNSSSGIDFPSLNVDMKVTSIVQPQSSCPFQSARQKIYGLGYNLLIFVYEKEDDSKTNSACLNIKHVVFIDKGRTADFQLTTSIHSILQNNGNKDDLLALFMEKHLPLDDISANMLAEEVLKTPPKIGYLTISNALQWRLQYGRVIVESNKITGIDRLL